LFNKVGNHIVAFDNLKSFKPQELANFVWAYATVGIKHSALFNKVGDQVVLLDNLKSFYPQALANTVWAFAKAGMQHPGLFNKVGEHIVALDNFKAFNSQALANIAWAYATAGVEHPDLFKKFADHIVASDILKSFKPQEISNIVWAYATAGVQHPPLFDKVGNHVVVTNDIWFGPQEHANIVWAFATANPLRVDLFKKIGIAIANRGDFQSFHEQELANIAWAYAVANADAPMIFNNNFTDALLQMQHRFISEHYIQLYQWHLWQTSELSHIGLPEELRERCYQAFATSDTNVSRLENDVVRELTSSNLKPVEKYRTPSGYLIDALVEVNGKSIGVEVDGPFHFNDRKPTGRTMLKRRQINAIDKIPLVSVPYWEWVVLGGDRDKKQRYLLGLVQSAVHRHYRTIWE
jgi:hypothetical protein